MPRCLSTPSTSVRLICRELFCTHWLTHAVKVRLQSQPTDRPLSFTGPLDCFKKTLNQEGIRGLYRVSIAAKSRAEHQLTLQGLTPPIIGAAMENATLFFVYNRCQAAITSMRPPELRKNPLSLPELALSGAGAGAVTSFVL